MDGKMRMNVEGDRLTILPHELIHKILSFLKIKDAIRTCVLSSRWWFFWTTMPYLNFSREDFSSLRKFSTFVKHVLSRRNNLTEVYSVKLTFRGKVTNREVTQWYVMRILNYAFSHNIQQLDVVFLLEKDMEFPLSLFSSQSLKHFSLRMQSIKRHVCFYSRLTSTWDLPSLTTLNLHYVTLCDDQAEKCIGVFSKCANLTNLTLNNFTTGSNGFTITINHPRLSNLTLKNCHYYVNTINVVAPQLENLTIENDAAKHVISAPQLASLLYKGSALHLSTDGFHSLEKADICVSYPKKADVQLIVCLLQRLHSVKFLTLNLEIVELLSSSVEPLLHQPSPFVNLKSLKIYPQIEYLLQQEPKKVAMSTELKSYLLDGSPRSTFTMVLREEIAAHKLMAELKVLLEKEKDNINTNSPHVEQGQATVESHKPEAKEKLKIGGNMDQIKDYWENLLVQIELKKEAACLIISKLQRIEELLTTLPASNRDKIQPLFSSLCVEANIAISKITDCVKIRCDENQSHTLPS